MYRSSVAFRGVIQLNICLVTCSLKYFYLGICRGSISIFCKYLNLVFSNAEHPDYLSVMGHNVNIRNVALLNIIYICIVFCISYIPPHSRLHGEDNVAIKRYVISFWNGVDLRYKLLQGPSVKISIAGIIISRVQTPFSFLTFNHTTL